MAQNPIPRRAKLAAKLLLRADDRLTRALSAWMGQGARLTIPQPVSKWAVSAYARYFGVEMDDIAPEAYAAGFPTFDAFFTRELRRGARAVDPRPEVLISPSDGVLRELIPLTENAKILAKSHAYALEELLADAELARSLQGGTLASIYLHPRDYHRVHVPWSGALSCATLVPGRLLPVTDAALLAEPQLFARNERLVFDLQAGASRIAIVMVAAFGVGHMTCPYHDFLPHPSQVQRHLFRPNQPVEKGSELGVFHLGSTVLVLVPRSFQSIAEPGPIQVGNPLFAAP